MTPAPDPSSSPIEYVITTLAEYQSTFWAGVARTLCARGCRVSLISFDDNSTRMLRAEGFTVYAVTAQEWATVPDREAVEARLREFGVADTPFWYTHEKWTFRQWDDDVLDRRLFAYLGLCERAIADIARQGRRPVMIQELGGFLSVIAAFFAARKAGVDNWFIEPSFFKGRSFWLRNTFAAKRVATASPDRLEPAAMAYIDQAIREQTIVIPIKDQHQYASPLTKVIKISNLKRLIGKITDKYIHRRRQEFGHVWTYVSKHLEMIVAAQRLRKSYTLLAGLGSFVYYPLHVPGDMALTLRSPAYLDQLALIETIARQLPRGYALAIKEHPAMIGALGATALINLLKRNQNVALINPGVNNYEVMAACAAMLSVNSKSGAEGILLGKPVIVLGDAFYRGSGLTLDLVAAGEIKAALSEAFDRTAVIDADARSGFFSAVWRESHAGELYVSTPDNLARFTDAMQVIAGDF